ncbi:DUF5677 domain-containing protein [Lysinibacillus fusiformis]|uniref:DUF5677 domain-containing protein n=1 Tax=Lysinibacillus fusiformis TaxID=28031 RepID=UPI002D78EDD7|nr:DUF5677 domain-containing protein [Lysinibacillus fusiformis]WRS98591.1 DUF5677 domain-containing protein [Lysinibacillus fusiformis]
MSKKNELTEIIGAAEKILKRGKKEVLYTVDKHTATFFEEVIILTQGIKLVLENDLNKIAPILLRCMDDLLLELGNLSSTVNYEKALQLQSYTNHLRLIKLNQNEFSKQSIEGLKVRIDNQKREIDDQHKEIYTLLEKGYMTFQERLSLLENTQNIEKNIINRIRFLYYLTSKDVHPNILSLDSHNTKEFYCDTAAELLIISTDFFAQKLGILQTKKFKKNKKKMKKAYTKLLNISNYNLNLYIYDDFSFELDYFNLEDNYIR